MSERIELTPEETRRQRRALLAVAAGAGIEPPGEYSLRERLPGFAAAILSFPMAAAGLISVNILFPDPEFPSYVQRIVAVLVAIFPPFVFAQRVRPSSRRHWAVVSVCLPAMYFASLAAPFAADFAGWALFASDPGAVVVVAWFALFYIALNAPFAALLVGSGAWPLKIELAEPTEDEEARA